jgi:hypothetical protein
MRTTDQALAANVRNTDSVSGKGMLPTKWTIGLCAVVALMRTSPLFDIHLFDRVSQRSQPPPSDPSC